MTTGKGSDEGDKPQDDDGLRGEGAGEGALMRKARHPAKDIHFPLCSGREPSRFLRVGSRPGVRGCLPVLPGGDDSSTRATQEPADYNLRYLRRTLPERPLHTLETSTEDPTGRKGRVEGWKVTLRTLTRRWYAKGCCRYVSYFCTRRPSQGRNHGCIGSSEWYLGGPLRTCPCSRRIALFPEQGDQPRLQKRPLARAFQTHVVQVVAPLGVATTSLI